MNNYDHEFTPKNATPSAEAGYHVPANLYKIGKACDEWLARRHALEGRRPAICQWKKATEYRPPEPERDAERQVKRLAKQIREHSQGKKRGRPPITVPREKAHRKYKTRPKKYATEEERRAAVAARVAEYWANLDPAKKAARVAVIKANKQAHLKATGKTGTPRHKRPEWLAYKREWERQNRAAKQLTPEQIERRRAKSRENYAKRRANNPEKVKAQLAARRAKHKAKVAAAAAQAAA